MRQARVLVVQAGARHRYGVARMFEQDGLLAGLYTDTTASAGWGRRLAPARVGLPALGRLRSRVAVGIPPDKIRTADSLIILEGLATALGVRGERYFDLRNRYFGHALRRFGVADATHVYSTFGEGLPFLQYAKRRGLKVAVEIYITPLYHEIVEKERRRFPGWEKCEGDGAGQRLRRRVKEILEVADIVVCPSQTVLEGLAPFDEFDPSRARLVPYGVAPAFHHSEACPEPGRILFPGDAVLRKGIQYFAAAAAQLAERGRPYHFFVAGQVSPDVASQPVCRHLTFLGRLSPERFLHELRVADMIVLPSLAEGSATVTSEALAAGVPVIVTPSTGSIVRDGIEGVVVRERDVGALADAIDRVAADRALRALLSSNAIQAAGSVSESAWGSRLRDALGL